MKKLGFTLVELLGVIIVLGLLALITTHFVMNNIEKAKKSSAIRSAEQIIKSVTLDYTTNDNFTTDKQDILSLDLIDKKPESGYIQFNENEKVRFYMIKNGYCVAKRYDSELVATKLEDTDICDWYTSPNTIIENTTDSILTLNNIEEGNLLNYKIYGNSYQETRSSKNLFDYQAFVDKAKELGAGNSISTIEGGIKLSHMDYQEQYSKLGLKLKENTVYTLSADVNWVSYTNDSVVTGFMIHYKDGTNSKVEISKNTTKINFTSLADKTIVDICSRGWQYQGEVNITNIQLEEGSVATEYIPYGVKPSLEYPSEIQSLGTLVTNSNDANYNKYKIDVKITGKNLFDLDSAIITGADVNDNKITANKDESKVDIYLKKGTYSIKIDSNFSSNIFLRKGQVNNGFFESMTGGNVKSFTFSEDGYLRISHFTAGNTISNIMIMNGSYTAETMPEYEPYKENKYSIYLDEPLRCVGDVCDYIDYENQMVVRNIHYATAKRLTTYIPTKKSNVSWFNINPNDLGGKHIIDCKIFSPIFKSLQKNWWQDEEGILSHKTSTEGVYLSLSWKRLGLIYDGANIYKIDDTEKTTALTDNQLLEIAKNYFNNIPEDKRIIYYPSVTKKYEHINLSDIKTFDGMNNIIVNDGNLNAGKMEIVALKK